MYSLLAEYWGRLQVAQHFFFRSFFFFKHLPFCAFAKHFAVPFLSSHAASTAASAMNNITRSSNLLMTAMAKGAAPKASFLRRAPAGRGKTRHFFYQASREEIVRSLSRCARADTPPLAPFGRGALSSLSSLGVRGAATTPVHSSTGHT